MTTTRERVARALWEQAWRGRAQALARESWEVDADVWFASADAAIRAMSEEVEAAYREGWLDRTREESHRTDSGYAMNTVDDWWMGSVANARLKEAGHDDHE